jgi:hypothetical protein
MIALYRVIVLGFLGIACLAGCAETDAPDQNVEDAGHEGHEHDGDPDGHHAEDGDGHDQDGKGHHDGDSDTDEHNDKDGHHEGDGDEGEHDDESPVDGTVK